MIFFVTIGGIYLYQNTKIAVDHFSYGTVDKNRLTITSTDNIFQMFGKTSESLNTDTVDKIETDERLRDIQVFHLVDIPVTANFRFFNFTFETDVPIFSVTDNVLTGAEVPVGISRVMMDFYNTQFAGSSDLFPQMHSAFLIGQEIEFTFGESKIFPSLAHIAEPVVGKVVAIRNDFPGFGIVLPESLVRAKIEETGYSLGKPYKIVAYMKNPADRAALEREYSKEKLRFDVDGIKKKQEQMSLIALGVSAIVGGITLLMVIFFLFLLAGYFRERRDVFRMISIFGLSHPRSYLMTLGEPIGMILLSLFISAGMLAVVFPLLHTKLVQFLSDNGILIELSPVGFVHYMIVAGIICSVFSLIILIGEWRMRRKYIFR